MRLALLLSIAVIASADRVEFITLNEGVLQQRLQLAHKNNQERYRRLVKLFEDTGCPSEWRHEQKVKGSKEPNILCDVPGNGESPNTILVGAHFDANGGDGVIDNWSGAILLPSLAGFMRRSPRRHKFEFIGFAGEEKGLLGSRTYVKALSKEEREQVAAVVTMDSLGLTSTKCWPNGSTASLISAAANVAAALKLDFGGVNVDRVGTTDSAIFKGAHIPVLSLHSVTQETWKTINGPKDVWSAVSWKDYYDTHRLISALLVHLDQTLP